jgi:hypothetical protein
MSGAFRFRAGPTGLLLALSLLAVAACALVASAGAGAYGAASDPHARVGGVPAAKPVYDKAWRHGVSKSNKRWATRVARCESGRDPNALGAGGTYRGAFQFHRKTWQSAPRSPGGDPIRFSYRTQAFIAVRLKMRDGAGHWPNCA